MQAKDDVSWSSMKAEDMEEKRWKHPEGQVPEIHVKGHA